MLYIDIYTCVSIIYRYISRYVNHVECHYMYNVCFPMFCSFMPRRARQHAAPGTGEALPLQLEPNCSEVRSQWDEGPPKFLFYVFFLWGINWFGSGVSHLCPAKNVIETKRWMCLQPPSEYAFPGCPQCLKGLNLEECLHVEVQPN